MGSPAVIISDDPYGLGMYGEDPRGVDELATFYEHHIVEWSLRSTNQTTLWFWCTELGWATVHPVLKRHGWRYVSCHTWNKGIGHIAGNVNTGTIRKFPVVTEVCVQYVRVGMIGGMPSGTGCGPSGCGWVWYHTTKTPLLSGRYATGPWTWKN